MSEVRRVLLANGQYIEIVQETGSSTGSVMSQSAVTTALNGKANSSHNHTASNITGGTFSSARIADGAITSGKLAANSVTTAKVADGAITRAKLASDVPISVTQYETVTVSGVCSDGSSIAGKQLSIGGSLYEFDSNGVVSANIPYGQVYTVKANMYNGYLSNNFYTYTASTTSRSITMTYAFYAYGIYIQNTTGQLYTSSNWNTASNQTPNAIVLFYNDVSCRIALQNVQLAIGNSDYGRALSYVSQPGLDKDGYSNTKAILSVNPSTKYAAGYLANYLLPDGFSTCYIPSAGEMSYVGLNFSDINNALRTCGGAQFRSTDDYYITSTLYSSTNFWAVDVHERLFSNNYYDLSSSGYIRPFARL